MLIRKAKLLLATGLVLGISACEPAQVVPAVGATENRILSYAEQQELIQEISESRQLGCEDRYDIDDTDEQGRTFTICRGRSSTQHTYAIRLTAQEDNPTAFGAVTIEFYRGHRGGYNALLNYFMTMAGVPRDDETERQEIRASFSGYINAPPRWSDYMTAHVTEQRMELEIASNEPTLGYTTLRLRNPDR